MNRSSNRESPGQSTRVRRRPGVHDQNNSQNQNTSGYSEDEQNYDSYDDEDDTSYTSSFNESNLKFENSGQNVSKNSTFDHSKHNVTTSQKYQKGHYPECQKVSPKSSWSMSCLITIAFIIFGLFGVTLSFFAQNTTLKNKLTIEKIHEKFPLQPNETLESIEAVIDDVLALEPIHPAVFLFLYDDNTKNDAFISTIANFACDKLNIPQNPIILDENTYNKPEVVKEFGYLIDHYRPLLEEQKVMVFKNLEKMSGKTARALHTFCDEITPLVDRAIYILTLKVDKYYGNEVHTAEIILNKIWGDLKNDILAPLITRVINTVIKIY